MEIELFELAGPGRLCHEPERCERCGATQFRKNGFYYPADLLSPPEQVWECKGNGYHHSWREHRRKQDWESLARRYVLAGQSLSSLIEFEQLSISKSTLNTHIRNVVHKAPTGIQLSESIKRPGLWGLILGVDLGYLPFGWKTNRDSKKKRERDFWTYVQCNDLVSKDRINYGLTHEKSAPAISVYLAEIRDRLDYYPKLIVIDLEPILIEALKPVFPLESGGDLISSRVTETHRIPLQGCLFHLELWLEKQLPTDRLRERVARAKGMPERGQFQLLSFTEPIRSPKIPVSKDEERLWRWTEVKRVAISAASASGLQEKLHFMSMLRALDNHGRDRVHRTILEFQDRAKYYHPRDELARLGITEDRLLTTNSCERSIRSVKALSRTHGGFKSPEAANDCINYLWQEVRTKKLSDELLDSNLNVVRRRKRKQAEISPISQT